MTGAIILPPLHTGSVRRFFAPPRIRRSRARNQGSETGKPGPAGPFSQSTTPKFSQPQSTRM